MPIFSWSALVFGSTATEITGSGNSIFSRMMTLWGSHSVSPVVTSLRPTAAAMSPARTSLISERSLACICRIRPMRSLRLLLGTNSWSPEFNVPEYTRKNVRLPTKGSFRILKASAEKGSASSALRVRGSPRSLCPLTGGTSTGEGMYSTMASSTACTPLFLKAEPQVTRQISFLRARARSRMLDLGVAEIAALEVFVEKIVRSFGGRLDHLGAPFPALLEHGGRDVPVLEFHTLSLLVPEDRLHLDEVHHADERILGADRQLDRNGIAPQARADLLDTTQEICPRPVHLVDERHPRYAVLVHLAPNGFRLRLHTGYRAVDRHGRIEDAQAPLHLDGEIDVSGRIDDVDAVLGKALVHSLPEARGCRGRDGDAALLLLFHVVHHRRAVVHLADLVRHPGIKQDALGRGGLARVDVRRDTDIAVSLDGSRTCHIKALRATSSRGRSDPALPGASRQPLTGSKRPRIVRRFAPTTSHGVEATPSDNLI